MRLHHAWEPSALDQIRDRTSRRLISHASISSIFALTAALGNETLMLVIWKTRELHSSSLTLLFSLAVADLLVAGLIGQTASFVAFKKAELLGNFQSVLYVKNDSVLFWVDNFFGHVIYCQHVNKALLRRISLFSLCCVNGCVGLCCLW